MRRVGLLLAICVLVVVAGATPAAAIPPPVPDVVQTGVAASVRCVVASGQVWCEGLDTYGQLGDASQPGIDGASIVRNVADTGPLNGAAQVVGGWNHACALLTNGQVRCWGLGGGGQLGNGDDVDAHRPVVVLAPGGNSALTGVRRLAAGDVHTCALLEDRRVLCWGTNISGQLGDGTNTTRLRAVFVKNRNNNAPLTGVAQLTAGGFHTCVTLTNRQARCWGENDHGQLGDGTTTDRRRPNVVENATGSGPLSGVLQVSGGGTHTCARLTGNEARCWGGNLSHQLGTLSPSTADRRRPMVVRNASGSVLTAVGQLTSGEAVSCARLTGGQVRCWGDDTEGQLGNGDPTGNIGAVVVRSPTGAYDDFEPPYPGNLTGITQIDAGGAQVCARRQDGRALCWGDGVIGSGNFARPTSYLSSE